MKKTGNQNINTQTYWSGIYGTPQKRKHYAMQGTAWDSDIGGTGYSIRPTARFSKALEYIKNGDKVLDIGCGVGVFTKLVKDTYPKCDVWGVDISRKVIEDNLKEHEGINYKQSYIGNLKEIPSDYFDVVFSGETLEHLDDPNDLMKDGFSSLKSSGVFVLTTPFKDRIVSPEHTFEFDHDDVEKLFLDNGFKSVEFIDLPDMEHLLVIFAVARK